MNEPQSRGGARELVFPGALIVAGWLLFGVAGGAVAIVGLLVTRRYGPRVTLTAAAIVIAVAALASVVEAPVSLAGLRPRFAIDRPVAAAAGAIAGILALIGLTSSMAAARRKGPPPPGGSIGWPFRAASMGSPRQVAAWVSLFGAAFLIRVVGAPNPLPGSARFLVDEIALGNGLRGLTVGGRVVMPAGPVVAALAPTGARGSQLLALMAAVLVVPALSRRSFEPRATAPAAVVAALLPSLWGQDLSLALVTALASAALVASIPARITPKRALTAGLLAGGATLARPEALAMIVVIVAWILAAGPRGRARAAAWFGLGAVPTLMVWLTWSHRWYGDWLPGATRPIPLPGGALLIGLEAGAIALAAFAVWLRRRRWRALLPYVAVPVMWSLTLWTDWSLDGFRALTAPLVASAAGAGIIDLVAELHHRRSVAVNRSGEGD